MNLKVNILILEWDLKESKKERDYLVGEIDDLRNSSLSDCENLNILKN